MSSEKVRGDRCPSCNGKGTTIAKVSKNLGVEVECETCHGTKVINSLNACTKCHGKGHVVAMLTETFGFQARCDHCNGSCLEPLEQNDEEKTNS